MTVNYFSLMVNYCSLTANYHSILTLEIIGFSYRGNLPWKFFITLGPGVEIFFSDLQNCYLGQKSNHPLANLMPILTIFVLTGLNPGTTTSAAWSTNLLARWVSFKTMIKRQLEIEKIEIEKIRNNQNYSYLLSYFILNVLFSFAATFLLWLG